MSPAVQSYLQRLDTYLAGVADVDQRICRLEGERKRAHRLECALSRWARSDHNLMPQPTRFSAFDLALVHGALTIRMETALAPKRHEPE